MTLKKLPNIKDTKFIDPITRNIICSYNQCYSKFVETFETKIWKKDNTDYEYKNKSHVCPDCNRKILSNADKTYNKNSLDKVRFG